MKKIAIANPKGGSGKTTTAVHLAALLAEKGQRTLLIDLDSQGHAILSFGIESQNNGLENPVVVSDTLAIASLGNDFAGDDVNTLLNQLATVENQYDFAIIDTPPALNALTANAIVAGNGLIVPIEAGIFSLYGAQRLLRFVEQVRNAQTLPVWALVTLCKARTKFTKQFIEELSQSFENRFNTAIDASIKMKEAAAAGKPITTYAKKCRCSQDYLALTEEFLTRVVPTLTTESSAVTITAPLNESGVTVDEFDQLMKDF